MWYVVLYIYILAYIYICVSIMGQGAQEHSIRSVFLPTDPKAAERRATRTQLMC